MVTGLDKFREAFLKYADNYVIIGGTACDIVLRDTDMKPRAHRSSATRQRRLHGRCRR